MLPQALPRQPEQRHKFCEETRKTPETGQFLDYSLYPREVRY